MFLLQRLQLLVLFEVRPAVFADRFEHRVASSPAFGLLRGEQGLVDELPDVFEDGRNTVATTNRLGGVESEPACEHRGTTKKALLIFFQQPVAPVHCSPERFVAGVG